MEVIKSFIKKYFESFAYFYSHLKYRIFIVLILSILIGVLDGFGLTMFLPLLQMVNDSSAIDGESLGKLRFLVDFLTNIGVPFNLISVLILMIVFFFAKGIVQYLTGVYTVIIQQNFVKGLRLKNIKGLNGLAYKYFIMSDVGRVQNTLTGEVDRVANSFIYYFTAFRYGILVAVYMAFAFAIDAQFAVLVTIGGGLTNFLYKTLYKNTKGASRKLTGENNIFQSLIIQNVANYKYLKATGSLRKYGAKLEQSVLKIQESNEKIGKLDALLTAGREPILITVVVAVIIIQTKLLGSDLAPILISLIFFYRALNYLMQMQVRWNKFLAVSGSLENMTAFGKELRANQEMNGNSTIGKSITEIQLEKISFYYGKQSVLENISLDIENKETIAFVGESGSGKTTLVNIISGLLPINSGELYINQKEISTIDRRSLQQKIGYITQDPVIFNDSLFNNVTFWAEKSESNLKKFWDAIQKAALEDFVNNLPDKENTVLGNNGVNLSGGQKQRISIARELNKDVEILILDEATSALDSETEKSIQKNIEGFKGKYTILIVAHRISTIKNADRIVVMKNGEISHINNYYKLMEESNYFRKLVELQEL